MTDFTHVALQQSDSNAEREYMHASSVWNLQLLNSLTSYKPAALLMNSDLIAREGTAM